LVVICGQQNYKLDTKCVIGGVVEEGTREGEVRGSISSNHVVHEKNDDFYWPLALTVMKNATVNRFTTETAHLQ
jgi:hypothetical protein